MTTESELSIMDYIGFGVEILASEIDQEGRYQAIVNGPDGVIFHYGDSDMGYSFGLLCEVGEPWQPWFQAEIDSLIN
jgi:hypothetical protein